MKKGSKHSDEAKEKSRRANVGKVFSAETKAKLTQAKMGNKFREGKTHTEEAKQKMRDAKRKAK